MIDRFFDGHIHTRLCHHGTGEMENYVHCALQAGLRKICFLEHMEEGIDYSETTWLTEDDFDYYFKEGERLKNIYGKKIEIQLGVEVGYNPTHCDELLARLTKRQWDRIGISYHFFKPVGCAQHLNLLSRKKVNIEALEHIGTGRVLHYYFDALLEAVTFLPGTFLCHLDAALRFAPHHTYSQEHFTKIKLLLKKVRERNMELEVNTSGIALRGEPFPRYDMITMAQKMGIPLTAGSDAHTPKDVGRFFQSLLVRE